MYKSRRADKAYKSNNAYKSKQSESDVKKIVLEWYTNGMFADILQDEYGRDLEEILQEEKQLKNY
jgi:hypothetical protein